MGIANECVKQEEIKSACPDGFNSNPVAMSILNVHTVILTFGKMRLSLSPLTGQQYILLKNPDQ